MDDDALNMSCSVKSVYNLTDPFIVENETSKAFGLGTITGIMISFVGNIILSLGYFTKKPSITTDSLDNKILLRTLVLMILVAISPILIMFITFGILYKLLCSVIIKLKDQSFVKFLDSFDVFWFLEGDSVINILGVIETESPELLVENMRHRLENLYEKGTCDKIFYRRNEDYGFYYWRKNSVIDMSEYVEMLEMPDKCVLNERDLENIMTDLSSQPLPYNDEGLFKIVITKQRVSNNNNEREEFGIIIRIHHSVGDGVALIDFLCESLADKGQSFKNAFNISEFRNRNTPDDLVKMITKLCEIPLCVVDLILRKPDENSLHGPTLLGVKHFKWTTSDENLLIMIKEIKENVKLNFFDVICTALAGGLNNYFHKTMTHVPEDVAVIVPIRFPPTTVPGEDRNKLNNDFTVAMFDLPVNEHKNINKMKSRFADFKFNNEYLANYYILKLASIFPKQILKPIFFSSQATVTLSNMPGPDVLTVCGGTLKKLVFFLPLKGISGVGVSAFCYGGVLRLALSVDVALVPNADDLDFILEGMVDEIRRMHELYAKK